MVKRIAVRLIATLAFLGASPVPLAAQEIDRIAAVVNDEAISVKDLEARVRMATVLGRLPDNLEVRRRVLPQVLRKMIDEHLQMQEAKRLKISLTPQEVENGISSIEKQSHLPKGALLGQMAAAGIDPRLAREQIVADLTWMRVAANVLHGTIRVGDEEVTDRLETLQARQGKPEFLVSEIFLPVDQPGQDDQVHALADRLIDQLHQGAPFPALASQFSRSATAANGGSMGWITEGMIDDELFRALSALLPGHVTPPVRADDGYHILGLADKRIAGATTTGANTKVVLAQMVLPVPENGPSREDLLAAASHVADGIKTCEGFAAKGQQLGASQVGRVGPVTMAELPPPVSRAIARIPAGMVAPPINDPGGIQLLMVCQRDDAVVEPLPSRDEIRRRIEAERQEMLTHRYLRDLQRAAFVEIRI